MSVITKNANEIPTHKCSFCGIDNVSLKGVMVAGPGVSICQECVLVSVKAVFSYSATGRFDEESNG